MAGKPGEANLIKLANIKRDAITCFRQCSERGLIKSAKWAAELNFSLDIGAAPPGMNDYDIPEPPRERDALMLAKTFFDLREYRRAAFFLEDCSSPKAYFLHLYSLYMAGEKKKLAEADTDLDSIVEEENQYLKDIRQELHSKYKKNQLDAFSLYLYAVVLKKLDLISKAIPIYVEALHKEPLIWSAWYELAKLIPNPKALSRLKLPDHWMKEMFMAVALYELQLYDDAFTLLQSLKRNGLQNSSFIMTLTACVDHGQNAVDQAVDSFVAIQMADPYRLEEMDLLSDLLFIKESLVELAHLAAKCAEVDKYRVETCCVIANYYSLRGEHEKAVLYFKRALKLYPHYLSAWTLLGHEYMEMKNAKLAVEAYQHAIKLNRKDYRAWYGLGLTYEILEMPHYCLYYYTKAQALRPHDSRMIVSLGVTYEKLQRLQEAKKCFYKAHCVGDMESGIALLKLARLHDRLKEEEQAVSVYMEYIKLTERDEFWANKRRIELAGAYVYLANYYVRRGNYPYAIKAARRCTEFVETIEEGKVILKEIAIRSAIVDGAYTTPPVEPPLDGIRRTLHVLYPSNQNSSPVPFNLFSP